ncbi:hypothetical protein J4727_18630 [Providencia rettgeri]|uniref:Uncharacterized protein n=1 Tax=Providencia rettgeri TaxID=587 RepID=A0A939SPL1_PRORE|nr:hypothetical protein [Providencia rettgeri]
MMLLIYGFSQRNKGGVMDKSRQQFEAEIKSLSDPSEFELKLKRANNGSITLTNM